jgi:hypothetical protein
MVKVKCPETGEIIEYETITNYIKEYITTLGGFEKFAEWGIQY